MAHSTIIKEYLGYELKSYSDTPENYLQVTKPRPYDDSEYYWVYTYDQQKWYGVYKGKVEIEFNNQFFEQVVEQIERLNKDISPRIIHN